MSIICKFFGHDYDSTQLGKLVIDKDGARVNATSICTRCGMVSIKGLKIDATEVVDRYADVATALMDTNDLLKAGVHIAQRSGKTTRWVAYTDALIDRLLDNVKTLKAPSDNILGNPKDSFLTKPREKAD